MTDQTREMGSKAGPYRNTTRWLIAAVAVLALAAAALGWWGYSEANRADDLAGELGVAEEEIDALESDLAAAESLAVEPAGWTVADLDEWVEATESGDYERVRALFTDDGIITTAWNTIGLYYGDTAELGTWDVNGSEFRRLATVHKGEDLTILGTPIQVGSNTVAYGWKWSSGISGTALLHLREGKIVVAVLNPSQAPIPFEGGVNR